MSNNWDISSNSPIIAVNNLHWSKGLTAGPAVADDGSAVTDDGSAVTDDGPAVTDDGPALGISDVLGCSKNARVAERIWDTHWVAVTMC